MSCPLRRFDGAKIDYLKQDKKTPVAKELETTMATMLQERAKQDAMWQDKPTQSNPSHSNPSHSNPSTCTSVQSKRPLTASFSRKDPRGPS